MVTIKNLDKLLNLTIKKIELDQLLQKLGFNHRGGKGSHEVWTKECVRLTVATHRKEVKKYILRQIIKHLKNNKMI